MKKVYLLSALIGLICGNSKANPQSGLVKKDLQAPIQQQGPLVPSPSAPLPSAQIEKKGTSPSETQSIAREKVKMLVIKGNDVKAKVMGISSSETFEIKTQGTVFRSRNGKALVIDGKDQPLECEIKVPADIQLCVSGGKLALDVGKLKSPMIIEGGNVKCKGKGAFHNTKITAATLDLSLEGIQKDLSILCGEGKIRVTYDLKNELEQKKSKGLSLKRPPTINLHLSKGEAVFVFPKESELFYRKGIKGLEAEGEPRYKGHDARVFVYIPPQGVKVALKKGTP